MDCNARAFGKLPEGQLLGLAELEQAPNLGGVVTGCGHDHHGAALAAGVQVGVTRRLPTVRALQDHDALDEDVKRLMVRGVTTRDYDEALGTISDGLGLKKSAVSAAFQKASQKDLDSIDSRSLSEWNFASVYIDGTGFKDHLCIVAMGITEDGHKHILGVRDGATENAELVGDMLDGLLERGLTLTPHALFVLDGSAALKKAVKKKFGARAKIQRCIVHKERNVLSYLPAEHPLCQRG